MAIKTLLWLIGILLILQISDVVNNMNKMAFWGLVFIAVLTGCGSGSEKQAASDTTPAQDKTGPVISNPMPPQSSVLHSGTTSTTLAVTTDEGAECRYAARVETSFEAMTGTFSTTGLNSHSTTISGLNDLNNDFIAISDDINGLSRPRESSYEPGPYEYSADSTITAPDLISTQVNESALELTPTSCAAPASPVYFQKARWQGNKQGALIIRFDDGTPGHALCGLEAFGTRGLTGTWYVSESATPISYGYRRRALLEHSVTCNVGAINHIWDAALLSHNSLQCLFS